MERGGGWLGVPGGVLGVMLWSAGGGGVEGSDILFQWVEQEEGGGECYVLTQSLVFPQTVNIKGHTRGGGWGGEVEIDESHQVEALKEKRKRAVFEAWHILIRLINSMATLAKGRAVTAVDT